jgi:carbamate kinase
MKERKEMVLIALGGNALLQAGEIGSAEVQIKHVQDSVPRFIELIDAGYRIAITHGNGPQVGDILLRNEMCRDTLPSMPLDVCGAQSQGQIGYMIQRELYNGLAHAKKNIPVACVLTQVLVNSHDPAFKNPTKPIGPFYTEDQAKHLQKEKNWTMVYQQNKGHRRVVPSPEPIDIIEGEEIKTLIDNDMIIISCGGGGIPVIRDEYGALKGVEAVIDKDRTAAVLAKKIGAQILMILSDVDQVAINFGKPNQKNLDKISLEEAKKYIAEGQFGKGSMQPKVEAACQFVKQGGKRAIITSLEKCKLALDGRTGTVITL